MYFSLCLLDKTFAKAAFAVTLLSGCVYTWYTTQHYAIGTGNANRLTWDHLKSDLQSCFKPPNYAYQIRVALSHCKQFGDIARYIHMFLQCLNRCSDIEEAEAIFLFYWRVSSWSQTLYLTSAIENPSASGTSGRINKFDLMPGQTQIQSELMRQKGIISS